ncbi:hypothetical protein [Pectobacterium aquaticum]|uniref:hypothetical protein n=1 Tax=Pectobacterium aquaticum TaxID=2204145 RepID=UPI000E23BD90|nr:hypothetical protein [Pectobacterium aquaticum]UEM38250.1 hypothetical protein DMB82_0013825 [Pectobacterium aquaticum]
MYQGPIRLVLFDVDGVLTDGSLYLDEQGERFKAFNVRDGLAIALLHAHGLRAGVLSGKSSKALDFRIQQLKFDVTITGHLEKREAYEAIKREQMLDDTHMWVMMLLNFPWLGLLVVFTPLPMHILWY